MSMIMIAGCVGVDILPDNWFSIHVDVDRRVVVAGQEVKVSTFLVNNFGDSVQIPDIKITLSDPLIAAFDNGVITTFYPGDLTIYAQFDSLIAENTIRIVEENQTGLAFIALSASKNHIMIGESLNIVAAAYDFDNELIDTAEFNWNVDDTSIATISESGILTGQGNGMTSVTAEVAGVMSMPLIITVGDLEERSGTFTGKNGYSVSGDVTVRDDGDFRVLQLESSFSAQNGPGLYIYLTNTPENPTTGIEVGKLRSNMGADAYPLPPAIGLDAFDYVIIHCKPFNIPFGEAQLN